jgi:hypothetical protein
MTKKKKNQTQEGVPANQNVFSGPAAAQAAASSQTANQTNQANAARVLPPDVAELVRSSLMVIVAQRRASGLAITLTAVVKFVRKSLESYLKRTPTVELREFVRNELVASGFPIFVATIESGGELYQAEVVMLYRNFDEIVSMIKSGHMNTMLRSLVSSDVDPLYDKMVTKGRAHVSR